MSLIRYEHKNALTDVVGEMHGITSKEIDQLLASAAKCTATLRKHKSGGPLDFTDLPDDSKTIDAIKAFAQRHNGAFDDLIVVGMGGSSLATLALYKALKPKERSERGPRLRLIDNTDPMTVASAMMGLDPARTLAVVISKSGTTLETIAGLALVEEWFKNNHLPLDRHIIIVTGPKGGFLNDYVSGNKLERFVIPEGVVGRYSALSPVGLLPAALLGFNIDRLLSGARELRDESLSAQPIDNKPLVAAAVSAQLLQKRGKVISVFMPYTLRLQALGEWYVQLWAESLGKSRDIDKKPVRIGQTPLVAVGASAQHSQLQLFLDGPNDKLFTLVEMEHFSHHVPLPDSFDYAAAGLDFLKGHDFGEVINAQLRATEQALREQSRPNTRIVLSDLSTEVLGAMMMFYQLQTTYAAHFLHVDAFDQPAVERGKEITRKSLGM